MPNSSAEKLLHEALLQSAAGIICTYSLGRMPHSLAASIAGKKKIPVINVYLNTLIKSQPKSENAMPEYKAVLNTVKKLTRSGQQQYTESERLTQRALLTGQLDRLVETMERQKEQECQLLQQQIRELEKLLSTYQNP